VVTAGGAGPGASAPPVVDALPFFKNDLNLWSRLAMIRNLVRRTFAIGGISAVVSLVIPCTAPAQEVAIPVEPDSATVDSAQFISSMAGEFTPSKGFDLFQSERASLNISFYGMARYLNQLPGEQTFTDHLGRERKVVARNDINWHRGMVWFNGHFWTEKLRYNITVWALASTQQTLLFGNLQYRLDPRLNFGIGMAPNLTIRSMQGSFPFWAGSDRQMSEEFFRGGFASGVFVTGEALPRFYYTASINTNLSQLGITATNDSRDLAYSGSVQWLPTTGEFGPRGGFGDLEHHETIATRFGVSAAHAREYRGAADSLPNNETQLRLSDGVYVFETGALADGVTVRYLDYDVLSFDAGLKYRGFSFQSEYYVRQYSSFEADGPLPLESILDHGFMAEAGYMVVPKRLGIYAVGGYVFDDFERNPWEAGGGAAFYPFGSRSWRLTLHLLHVDKSPTGSNFGYYTAGQTGTILSLGTDFIL
jgi:hypothetical protein